MIMILIQTASAGGVFDIMEETIYTGNWSETEHTYNLPPDNGNWNGGNIYVVQAIRKHADSGDGFRYNIYTRDYQCGLFDGSGKFGVTRCRGDGCWVDSVSGSQFFILESVYNSQSNHTKQLIRESCGGVVPSSWEPFRGNPNNPYDVDVENREVVWGYVGVFFENMSRINGEYRIPSDDAIQIASGSWDEVRSDEYDRDGKWRQHLWGVEDAIQYVANNGTVSAMIDITVKWAHKRRNMEGRYDYQNHTSRATFSDTATMPTILNRTYSNATIVCHNNSVTPYSLIAVHIDENVTSTEIVYRNRSSTYHNKIGILTSDGEREYFDFIDEPAWLPDASNIVTRRGGYYVINEAPLNMSELIITVSTPYTSYEVVDYNVTVIHSKPTDYVHWEVMAMFLSLLGLFVAIPYILLRRLR